MNVTIRRPPTAAAITLVLGAGIASLGGGLAGASVRDAPGNVHVAGSATNEYPGPVGPGSARLDVAASAGPSGNGPLGEVHARGTTGGPMGDFAVQGPVTCVRIDGNRAAIKYRFASASGSAAPFAGGGVEVFIEDNGPPGAGTRDANAFDPPQPAGVFDLAATQCDDPNGAAYDAVRSGNYTVSDRGAFTAP
jgi:hypothetical protein